MCLCAAPATKNACVLNKAMWRFNCMAQGARRTGALKSYPHDRVAADYGNALHQLGDARHKALLSGSGQRPRAAQAHVVPDAARQALTVRRKAVGYGHSKDLEHCCARCRVGHLVAVQQDRCAVEAGLGALLPRAGTDGAGRVRAVGSTGRAAEVGTSTQK